MTVLDGEAGGEGDGALPLTDGTVTLRSLREGDVAQLIAERDGEFRRFMGEGRPDPRPTAVIEVDRIEVDREAGRKDGILVGWVDHDHDALHTWLEPHECNVGYHVFAAHRGRGIAQRGVRLLLELLAREGSYEAATFLIDAENNPSLRVAAGVGATERWRRVESDGRTSVFLTVAIDRA